MKFLKIFGLILLFIFCSYWLTYLVFQQFKIGVLPWKAQPLFPEQLPKIITANYQDLNNIAAVSRFRSGIGHDAADSFESCRSLKHYFIYKTTISDTTKSKLFSPVNGKVMALMPDGKDKQIWIRPDGFPNYSIRIYHAKPLDHIKKGAVVKAGDHIAFQSRSDTNSDIQVGISSTTRTRFVSYFELLTDELFESYKNLGIKDRSEFIISKEQRDADPLKCKFGLGGTGSFRAERPNEVVNLAPETFRIQ